MTKETKSTFEVVAEERLLEAERLKKAWFDHVLASLEKLAKSVDKLSSELHDAKDSLYKEIVSTKEVLRSEMAKVKSDASLDLEKLERRVEKSIDNINKSIEAIPVQQIKDELKTDADALKKELDVLKDTKFSPLSEDVVKLKVKFAMWGIIGGIIGAAIIGGIIKWFIPILFKSVIFP